MDAKAKKCIFLGYGKNTKGYRLYDPKRARVFFSRDVLFNELSCGLEKEPDESEQNRYITIDVSSDKEPVFDDTDSQLRRSERERRQPSRYGEWVTLANDKVSEPITVKEALDSPNASKWQSAMQKEMKSLHDNDVWELVELQPASE